MDIEGPESVPVVQYPVPRNATTRALAAECFGSFAFVLLHLGLTLANMSTESFRVAQLPGFAPSGTPGANNPFPPPARRGLRALAADSAFPPATDALHAFPAYDAAPPRMLSTTAAATASTDSSLVSRYMYFAIMTGVLVAVIIFAIGPISFAHFNPAFTLGVMVTGAMRPLLGLGYIAAQLVGGFAATGIAFLSVGEDVRKATQMGSCLPSTVEWWKAGINEIVGLFVFLTIVYLIVHYPYRMAVLGPVVPALIVGATAACTIFASLGALPGLSFNAARCLPPAFYKWNGEAVLVYLVGDMIAGTAAGMFFWWITPFPPAKHL